MNSNLNNILGKFEHRVFIFWLLFCFSFGQFIVLGILFCRIFVNHKYNKLLKLYSTNYHFSFVPYIDVNEQDLTKMRETTVTSSFSYKDLDIEDLISDIEARSTQKEDTNYHLLLWFYSGMFFSVLGYILSMFTLVNWILGGEAQKHIWLGILTMGLLLSSFKFIYIVLVGTVNKFTLQLKKS